MSSPYAPDDPSELPDPESIPDPLVPDPDLGPLVDPDQPEDDQ
jgi:hypothetical protein